LSTPIAGWQFANALIEAGVITADENVRRLVLDVSVDGPVVLYVERYGDDRLLHVATTLAGVQVVKAPAAEAPDQVMVKLAGHETRADVVAAEVEQARVREVWDAAQTESARG
jgi:hypothetical protein